MRKRISRVLLPPQRAIAAAQNSRVGEWLISHTGIATFDMRASSTVMFWARRHSARRVFWSSFAGSPTTGPVDDSRQTARGL